VAPQEGPAPEITDVRGNDTTSDGSTIANGLLVTGSNLATACFELRSNAGAEPLEAAYRYNTSAELYLPEEIRSGEYTLVVTNQAGADQCGLTLQLPELTGNAIVERLNTEATDKLTLDPLPVGTSSTELARGDHDHDDVYALRDDTYAKDEVYTKDEVYNTSEVYTKDEVYSTSEVYTKAEVDIAIAGAGSSVDAGYGLELSGSVLSADTAVLQQRVTGRCEPGSAVVGINADGSVDCSPSMVVNTAAHPTIVEIDASASSTHVDETVLSVTLTIPGPGYILATGWADCFFRNYSATTNSTGYLTMAMCDAPDVVVDSDHCYENQHKAMYAYESAYEPSELRSVSGILEFQSGGQKTVYFNMRVSPGDVFRAFRSQMVAYFVPALSP
jgi:hypothetical protein